MSINTGYERNILKKYKTRSYVTSEIDRNVLEDKAGIGFVNFGFDFDKMEETAELTESGKVHLNR